MAKSKKPGKATRAAKAAPSAKSRPADRTKASSAIIHKLAESPPPKDVKTLKAASDVVDCAGDDRDNAPSTPAPPVMRSTEQNGAAKEAPSKNGASIPLSPKAFAVEMQRMAKESIEQTTHVLEQMRGARGLDEIVSLQTAFMQQSFQRYTNFAQRLGDLMIASQAGLFRQGETVLRTFRSPTDSA